MKKAYCVFERRFSLTPFLVSIHETKIDAERMSESLKHAAHQSSFFVDEYEMRQSESLIDQQKSLEKYPKM